MIELRIEQGHIDGARRGDCYECPIARALGERYRGRAYVGHVIEIVPDDDSDMIRLDHSNESMTFMYRYDQGEDMPPCTIDLSEVDG